MEKIFKYKDLNKLLKTSGNKGFILVGGCFDILHFGHIKFLENAKKYGDKIIIALESDKRVRKLKGENRPFHKQTERAEILANLTLVDYIIMLPSFSKDSDYKRLVETIRPEVIATTAGDQYLKQKKKQAEKVGAKVVTVTPRIHPFSSSKLAQTLGLD
ncbi:MAG: Glycerol-3-phosphate cytidyltransferase TagD [Candidatus Gottesmanbacteria bacterium GW2011_GWA2_41_12]|uniref:Glycerol-3-phosphate cytidyltransferase TagD n=1 Tax=Candidatus Gottesmanbacteria bacterium GW2011_GWA2_41_12 TaxID=1618440 RepID=A0A0G0ULI4_9BACT|nr:MAG: Glycerol-3-phosphate cytidyltransferase TagD [Candidatus Gottesmanbacteria bacterium GW2011_GWA2_41_12]